MQRITFPIRPFHKNKSVTLKQIFGFVVMTSFALQTPTMLADGPVAVNLKSAARFTILAGAAITTTGGGIINGDVGASPITGSAIGVPQAQVNGTIYAVDATGPAGAVVDPALLLAAKGDLTTAYNDARDRTPVPSGALLNPGLLPGSGNIGGMNLVPGLYKFTGTASITGADVTLTGGANDVWIFQVANNLQVDSALKVNLAGGAQARNVFWQVGTSVIIGTFASFKGTIMADQGITMNTSSTMEGRALAFTAGVIYNGNAGSIPLPEAPHFTAISHTATNSVIVLNTTPYFLLTLQSSTNLSPTNWTTISTNVPVSSPWMFTNGLTAPHVFYRAFITAH